MYFSHCKHHILLLSNARRTLQPSVVGSAALPLRTVLHSASLSYRSSLDVKDKIETDVTDETRSSASSKQQTCSPPPPFYWSADMQHSRPGGQTCAVGSLMVRFHILILKNCSRQNCKKYFFPVYFKLGFSDYFPAYSIRNILWKIPGFLTCLKGKHWISRQY